MQLAGSSVNTHISILVSCIYLCISPVPGSYTNACTRGSVKAMRVYGLESVCEKKGQNYDGCETGVIHEHEYNSSVNTIRTGNTYSI